MSKDYKYCFQNNLIDKNLFNKKEFQWLLTLTKNPYRIYRKIKWKKSFIGSIVRNPKKILKLINNTSQK
ncbi:hypothetical protein CQA53_06640 [Helicobacter didelphidarum]|uniref:Uncharacterized protein n=1 Tax=Helicobacter didelphidarum TaxID=2040648 RepID=A0A3D8IJP2_9HELI|nr:hypothetical protein CQA53_06640 [Helicobacter didelphidarum]